MFKSSFCIFHIFVFSFQWRFCLPCKTKWLFHPNLWKILFFGTVLCCLIFFYYYFFLFFLRFKFLEGKAILGGELSFHQSWVKTVPSGILEVSLEDNIKTEIKFQIASFWISALFLWRGYCFQKAPCFLSFLGLFKFSALTVVAKTLGYSADERNVEHLSIDKYTCMCYTWHKTLCCAAINTEQSWNATTLAFPLSCFALTKRKLEILAESCFADNLWDGFRKVSYKLPATFHGLDEPIFSL